MSDDIAVSERMDSACSKLILDSPLYYIPIARTVKVQTKRLPTMGVGPIRRTRLALYYNPDFVKQLNKYQLAAILKHEALHILLQHVVRGKRYGASNRQFNIGADLTINPHLKGGRDTGIPEWAYFPETLHLPEGESAEWYCSELKKRKKEFAEKIKGELGNSGIDDAFFDSLEGDLIDDHSLWDKISESDKSIVAEKIRRLANEAVDAERRRKRGTIPGSLLASITAANKPIINWKKEAKYFIGQVTASERQATRKRPNRRFGYAQPGKKKVYKSKILVAIDTSGSVSETWIAAFLSEFFGMLNHVIADIICFDAQCYGEPVRLKRKNQHIKIEGRGGTNFVPPINMAEELGYKGLVMMTDGECFFPPAPKCRTLWVLPKGNEEIKPPFGKTIYIPKHS